MSDLPHDLHLPGEPPVPLVLRRSGRARRITLRISQLDGRVTLTLPKKVSVAEALSFARQKESWIRGHLDARSEDVPVMPGSTIPLEGQPREIVTGLGRRIEICGDRIAVPGPGNRVPLRLAGHFKELARDRLAHACDIYAARLGRPYTRITMRDTRSRWGSCTSDGALMFSWRLIMGPEHVLNYVAAHEVAHLAHMNHSAAFWEEVSRLYGDYAPPRRWLRVNGHDLHRYKFK